MIMKRQLLFLFLTALSFLDLQAQQQLGLREAIQLGLQNNFDILIAGNQVKVNEINHAIGNAGMLPTVGVVGTQNFSIQNIDADLASGNELKIEGAQASALNLNAVVSWTLFDGRGMFLRYQNLGDLTGLSRLESRLIMEDALTNIITAYYRVYVESERMKALENTLEISKERLDIAAASFEVGRVSKLERQQAQVDFNADRSAYIQQREILKEAKVSLMLLLAMDPNEEYEVDSDFDLAEITDTYTALEESALSSNTNLQIAYTNTKIAYNQLKLTNAERWPVLSFEGGGAYGRAQNPAGFLVRSQTDGFNYGLALRWNIFNGWDVQRRTQINTVNKETAQLQTDRARLQIRGDLATFYTAYQNNIELAKLEEENLEVAKENAEIALERYKIGKSNPLELREAQINALDAEIRLLSARFNVKIAEVNLLRVTGKLVD
jgi:outer membrane protein